MGSAQNGNWGNSVLASGNWGKLAITQEGIYKVDIPLLNALGFAGNSFSSTTIQLFGNGGAILPENNAIPRINDLAENNIEIVDGGDGLLNGTDYILFYAAGPNSWLPDTSTQSFRFQKNIYSDTSFYFITIANAAAIAPNNGAGKRITQAPVFNNPSVFIRRFQDRYAYENDLFNLLHSGKEWVGESFSNNFGANNNRNFNINFAGLILTEPIRVSTSFTGRSVGANAEILVSLNGNTIQTIQFAGVSGDLLGAYARAVNTQSLVLSNQQNLVLTMQFQSASAGAEAWLNQFTITGKRSLAFTNNQLLRFRHWGTDSTNIPTNTIGEFSIANIPANVSANNSSLFIWNISNPLAPIKMPFSINNGSAVFTNELTGLQEYIAFTPADMLTPIAVGKVNNQNLHNKKAVQGIIVTHSSLLSAAERLAAFHLQQYGYSDLVVTTDQIYNEFSSGSPDPSAIRDCIKYYHPNYVLLFGAGSFDPKNRTPGNINLVPVYESSNSLDPLASFTSDDFFGLINDVDDINNTNTATPLSIAVGRIPVAFASQANIMVDKIIRYHNSASLGEWRTTLSFLADDQDNNLHFADAESLVTAATIANPIFHSEKIYLDAFPLVNGAGGPRYPAVNELIVNKILNGTLIFNYSGHGNYQRLTEEAVFSSAEVNRFNNANKLPLFITASCDFAPHDDPTKASLGEKLLHANANGGIALLTTSRLVFAYSNRIMNENFLTAVLTQKPNGSYLSLGDAVMLAKNNTTQNNGDLLNSRKFALLGDPALQLAFPKGLMRITSINGKPYKSNINNPNTLDSLQALGKYSMEGKVLQSDGSLNNQFNGIAHIIIYDKPQRIQTLGNAIASPITAFDVQNSILFNGKALVENGLFTISFVMPKDIHFKLGTGTISLYASDGISDAAGSYPIGISGYSASVNTDTIGPTISLFLNDTLFKNGGISAENPILIAQFFDSSGINATGNSIGHDITVIIDGDERNKLILNPYFSNNINSYQTGQLRFQLPLLAAGKHQLTVKAWDVWNNSNEDSLHFIVANQEKLVIGAVQNFPNPFIGTTHFGFEHNQPNTNLLVQINIFTTNGQLVKTIQERVNTGGSRNVQLAWQGDSNFGRKLARGTYFYRIIVSADAQKITRAGILLLY